MQSTEVITHNQRSDLVDPLVDYSSLSLFKQSLNLSSSSSTSNSSIFDSIQTHTKARVLSSPHKLFTQTTTILEDNMDVSKADKTQPVSTENDKVPRERRPALGLKRTKFSVKPMPSQSAMNLEPCIDFDKITDPDELFTAFERMENAKKEVQKLKGEPLSDLDLNSVSLAPRRRRPSLLGRSATYTHRSYPSISTTDVDETLLPSQETTSIDMLSPSRSDIVPDATLVKKSSSMRLPDSKATPVMFVDSKATTTSKISELDELLSSNYEGLDEDGVQNLLRDKLQIKSVDIGKALLPDWGVPLRESLTSSLGLPKMAETVSRLHDANKAVSSKHKKSPAKPSSPLASISLLNKHIGKRSSSTNVFSSHYFDSSPTKSSNPSRESEKGVDQAGQSEEVDAIKGLSKFRSPTQNEDVLVSGETPIVSVAEDMNPNNDPQEKEVVLGQSDDIDAMKSLPKFRRSPAHGEEDMVVSAEPSFDSLAKAINPTNESQGKEAALGQSDDIDAMKSLYKFRRSPAHGEEDLVVSEELSFDSVAKDINPTHGAKEKEVMVGNSDQSSARTGSCELKRSPAYGKLDTSVSGDDPFLSVAKDVDQTSEPKEKEILLGKSDQIGTRSSSCEVQRSSGHEEERTAVSDIGLTVEPENQENEVAASQESARQELIIESLMEIPSSNGGGMSEPLNTEKNPGEELSKKKLKSSKRKFKEKGKPKASSEAAVSERTEATTSQLDVPVSEETRTKRRKVEGAQPRPSKKEKRFSLCNAGTKWDNGVRRSTRIRMRPLEYWNGERFLYGRVHESLLTVIGVRYASPSKETEVKVKSFVSDEYKDLVERISLY